MPLALITPTRNRWPSLIEQAHAIAAQLAPDDLWIIGCDCALDSDVRDAVGEIAFIVPTVQTVWVRFDYCCPCNVNRLHNALAAMAPPSHDLVEVDDHDPLTNHALSEIRHAFEAGYDYVFGVHHQRVQIEQPDGTLEWEAWPTVTRYCTSGAFASGNIDAIAVRAIKRSLWAKLGGWSEAYPGGDKDFAIRAEAAGARIVCLEQPLCTVTIEPSGIMGRRSWLQAADSSPSSGTSGHRSTNRHSRSSVSQR